MRTRSDKMMAAGGLSTILAQTLFIAATPTQLTVMVLGIILILAALLRLGHRLQPDKRLYLKLRAEVDRFLALVRNINAHAVAGEGERASQAKTKMHESVERIALVAGVVGGEN